MTEQSRSRTVARLICILVPGGLLLAVLMFKGTPAVKAHIVPSPCDFTTGGGFVITDNGNHANFGLVGGCKNGGVFCHFHFFGHHPTPSSSPPPTTHQHTPPYSS